MRFIYPKPTIKQRTQLLDIVTTGDDKILKFWDYISETGCKALRIRMQRPLRHVPPIHLLLPIIVSGSIKIWPANTYRLENTLNSALSSVRGASCCTRRRKRSRSNSTMVLSCRRP